MFENFSLLTKQDKEQIGQSGNKNKKAWQGVNTHRVNRDWKGE